MLTPRIAVALAVALPAALATAPSLGGAQSAQTLSVQASGLYVGTYGTAYEGLKNGAGFEAQLRYTPSAWSFGAGGQLSMHDIDDDGFSGEQVRLAGVFIEPRRVLDFGNARFAPYVSARLAFLRQSIDFDVEGESVSASANGTQVNVGGGGLIRLSPRVNLDLGATYGLINFGAVEVTVPGLGTTEIEGSSGSGRNLVLRAGLSIGLR